jgi:hypothetical protein
VDIRGKQLVQIDIQSKAVAQIVIKYQEAKPLPNNSLTYTNTENGSHIVWLPFSLIFLCYKSVRNFDIVSYHSGGCARTHSITETKKILKGARLIEINSINLLMAWFVSFGGVHNF